MRIGEEIKQDHFDDEHHEAVVNLLYTSLWLQRIVQLQLKPYGITPEQYNILQILVGNEGGSYCLQEIQERLLNKTSNTTRVVENLRKKGLLSRRASRTNRRKVEIRIKAQGIELAQKMKREIDLVDTQVRNAISKKEAQQLSQIADKLRTNFD